ncbi:hypothetical protein [Carboxylicivirga taeanensis]|uniref:hypothetical protein n=1 Tax=Carboxylicivirga taeanensis TaxID=1416875 RepID=UPI003F6DD838
MLKINKHLNKGKKHLIGSFKTQYSLNEPIYKKAKWVDESNTKETEVHVGHLFIQYLREIEKKEVMYFSHNPDDDHKNPDIFVHLDGKQRTVQITQFVISDYLSKVNQARQTCEKLSDLISKIYKPPIKVNIQICTPWSSDEIPQGRKNVYKKLAKVIAKSISENIEKLTAKNEYLNFHLDKTDFSSIAENYNLYPVPENYHSNFYGSNNIYIDYGFDNINIFEEDIATEVNRIFNKKNDGKSEILVIWGDANHFMNTESIIIEYLQKKFKSSSFKYVYFLTFHNVLDIEKRVIRCKQVN